MDAVEDVAGVFAAPHDDDALHGIVIIADAAGGLEEHAHPAQADGVPDGDRADVADADGGAAAAVHRDGADVRGVPHEAQPAHDVHFRAVLDIGAAGVAVAIGQRGEDLLEREIVGLELQRIDLHLVLLGRPAKAHHVHHARDGAQLAFDHPVFQRLQFHRRNSPGGL